MTSNQPNTGTATTEQALNRAFSRRAMLRGVGITGLGALLGPTLLHGSSADAATPNRADRRAAAARRPADKRPATRKKTARARSLRGASLDRTTPYNVQASCELSDEYFMTDSVQMSAGDQVLPFRNPNTHNVDAIVFSNGAVNWLYRDSAKSSGWTFAPFPLNDRFTSVSNVALAANGSTACLLVCGTPGYNPNDPNPDDVGPTWTYTLQPDNTWYDDVVQNYGGEDEYDPSEIAAQITGGVSNDGSTVYFSTYLADPYDSSKSDVIGWIVGEDTLGDVTLSFTYLCRLDVSNLADVVVLYDSTGNDNGYLFYRTSDTSQLNLGAKQQSGTGADPNNWMFETEDYNVGTEGVTELMWAWMAGDGSTPNPVYAFQAGGTSYFVDENGNDTTLADNGASGANSIAVWRVNGDWAVNVIDTNDVLTSYQPDPSGTLTGYPVTNCASDQASGLASIFCVPTDPDESTLFAIGLDEYLRILTLDATGWTESMVCQDGTTTRSIPSYRIQISIADANGVAVPGVTADLSSDRPVGVWMPTGSAFMLPDYTTPMVSDARGEVVFSLPAEELDCAQITATVDGASGPFTVTPDSDLRGFLGGTGAVSTVGPINSGTALVNAKNADGSSVFPKLDSGSAGTVATALGQCITAGNGTAPNSGDVKSMKIEFHGGGKATVSTSKDAKAHVAGGGHHGTNGVGFSLSHLFDTIGHALRHAAAKLTSAVVRWADDVKGWVVDLVTDIGTFTAMAITDMKDAFHVIGGFFQQLGADIEHAVEWLMRKIIALLEACDANAKIMAGWFNQASAEFVTQLNSAQTTVDNFWSNAEATVNKNLDTVLGDLTEFTFGDKATLPPVSNSDTGTDQSESDLEKGFSEIGKVLNYLPGKWLLDKLLSYLPSGSTMSIVDTFDDDLESLAVKLSADVLTDADALMNLVWTTFKDVFASRDSFTEEGVTDWFAKLRVVLDDGIKTAEDVCDAIFDLLKDAVNEFDTIFTYEFSLTSVSSIIRDVLDAAKIDTSFSVERLSSLIVAFPATLIADIAGMDTLFPGIQVPSTGVAGKPTKHGKHGKNGVGDGDSGLQTGLNVAAAVVQAIWGLNDIVVDMADLDGDGGGYDVPIICNIIDIVAPIALTILQWPSDPDSPPFSDFKDDDLSDMLPAGIATALLPPAMGIVQMIGDVAGAGFNIPEVKNDPFETYVTPLVNALAGLANALLMAIYYGLEKEDGWGLNVATSVVGNVSYLLGPLSCPLIADPTENGSVVVKIVGDGIANIATAIMIAESS